MDIAFHVKDGRVTLAVWSALIGKIALSASMATLWSMECATSSVKRSLTVKIFQEFFTNEALFAMMECVQCARLMTSVLRASLKMT